MTENVIGNLDNLNEATRFDDWLSDFDDDPEIDGDCNESQPCRGDEYCDDGYDDSGANYPTLTDTCAPATVVVSSQRSRSPLFALSFFVV